MSALLELAERCEKAKGPDRELDWDILKSWKPRGNIQWSSDPAYTASLDAALTLVPEDVAWTVDGGDPTCLDGASLGPIPRPGELLNPQWVSGAATPALALCAAALRARAA